MTKHTAKEMHEAVASALVDALSKFSPEDREFIAANFFFAAQALRDESGGHFVPGDVKAMDGSPIGLKVAALEDIGNRLQR